jgi:hypothetical protein
MKPLRRQGAMVQYVRTDGPQLSLGFRIFYLLPISTYGRWAAPV